MWNHNYTGANRGAQPLLCVIRLQITCIRPYISGSILKQSVAHCRLKTYKCNEVLLFIMFLTYSQTCLIQHLFITTSCALRPPLKKCTLCNSLIRFPDQATILYYVSNRLDYPYWDGMNKSTPLSIIALMLYLRSFNFC